MFVAGHTLGYSHETKTATLDVAFVTQLLKMEWVPDTKGNLHAPELVAFSILGWKPAPFLLSKINFEPASIDQLAEEAGIEPVVLDLLKSLGVKDEAELRRRLDLPDDDTSSGSDAEDKLQEAVEKLFDRASNPTPPVPGQPKQESVKRGCVCGRAGLGTGTGSGGEDKRGSGARGDRSIQSRGKFAWLTGGQRTRGSRAGGPFNSFVAMHLEDEEADPDDLESRAIEFILSLEEDWQQTPTHIPGFDLFETGLDEQPTRWCEIKAITGSLTELPASLSRTQFDCAREHDDAFWLYFVERAGTFIACVVRILDPAGNARTFTFVRGWLDIAELDLEEER